MASSYVIKTSKKAGQAASIGEKAKENKYQELSEDYIFSPISVETLGPWGEQSMELLRDIGSRIAERTGDKRQTSYLFQRLSIAVQRGNAMSISSTLPNSKKLDTLFDLS